VQASIPTMVLRHTVRLVVYPPWSSGIRRASLYTHHGPQAYDAPRCTHLSYPGGLYAPHILNLSYPGGLYAPHVFNLLSYPGGLYAPHVSNLPYTQEGSMRLMSLSSLIPRRALCASCLPNNSPEVYTRVYTYQQS